MPWFKVDDNLSFHHKVVAAGNPAMGLWVRAGSLSAQQLTDGFIPDHMAAALGTKAQAERLVTVGLWSREKGGYRFHEWTERQPSKADVEAERLAHAERMRAYRERKKKGKQKAYVQVSEVGDGARADHEQGTSTERSVLVQAPRPDPTRPDPSSYGTSEGNARRKRPAKRLPDDWQPTPKHRERERDGIDVDHEAEKFRLHADANDRRQANWNAAFSQWLLNARPSNNVHPLRGHDDRHIPPFVPPVAPAEIADDPIAYQRFVQAAAAEYRKEYGL